MIKRIMLSTMIVLGGFIGPAMVPAQTAMAGCNGLLTFPAWYRGLTDGDCNFKPKTGADGISQTIWTIVLNVLEIMIQLVAYIAAGYIIWGGFLYLTSGGSSDAIVRARKMIINAVIGLTLSLFAVFAISYVVGNIIK